MARLFKTSITSENTVTGDKVVASNNGNGQNFQVGDDVWLGDINVANTMSLKGQQSATSGYIRFGGDSNAFGYDGTKLSYAGNLTTSGLTLSSTTSPIILNASAGSSGQVLTSAGAGATPTWTTVSGGSFTGGTLTSSLTLRSGTSTSSTAPMYFGTSSPAVLTTPVSGAVEYDGIAFYKTANATTGRAVDVASYYYVSDGSYGVDHSITSTAKSIFGSASTGLVLVAGTTYEVELNVYVSITVVGVASPTWSHSFLLTTVSGTPTTTIYQQISTSSNTTSFATASTVSTLRNINNATTSVLASISTGSRYSIYTVKGIIRVTGSGSVEISPAATASATSADYGFVAAAGSYIKITPLGNGTVTNVGSAWV